MMPLRIDANTILSIAAVVICGCGSGVYSEAPLRDASDRVSEEPTKRLLFEPSSLELRDLTVNTSCSFSLLVRNIGRETVTVEKVSAGCACTDVTISEKVLEAGDSAKIRGVFIAGHEPGEPTRSVVVTTKAGESFEVPLKARIIRSLAWKPESVTLRPDILTGQNAVGQFEISNLLDGNVILESITSDNPHVIAEIKHNGVSKENQGVISVRASANMLARRTVILRCITSRASERTLELPVNVLPTNYLEVNPSSIHLGVVTPTQLANQGDCAMLGNLA